MSDNTLAQRPQTGMDRVKSYMLSPEVKERFSDMMGSRSLYYLNQVLTVVANSPQLQECTPQSILISAMRAATMQLSVDPAQGQAWIIPYKGVATYQVGYKGVRELALRTREYVILNDDGYWYEGETFEPDRMTGLHKMGGKRTSNKIAGYFVYFKLRGGLEKTFAMTVQEIEEHAAHYSQAYSNPKSKWNDPWERPKMMKKTVLVNCLRRYGKFNPSDMAMLEEIESEQEGELGFIQYDNLPDPDEVTVLPAPAPKPTAEILAEFGYEDNSPHAPVTGPTDQHAPVETEPITQSHAGEAYDQMTIAELAGRHTHYTKLSRDANQPAEVMEQSKKTADYIEGLIKAKRAAK